MTFPRPPCLTRPITDLSAEGCSSGQKIVLTRMMFLILDKGIASMMLSIGRLLDLCAQFSLVEANYEA